MRSVAIPIHAIIKSHTVHLTVNLTYLKVRLPTIFEIVKLDLSSLGRPSLYDPRMNNRAPLHLLIRLLQCIAIATLAHTLTLPASKQNQTLSHPSFTRSATYLTTTQRTNAL